MPANTFRSDMRMEATIAIEFSRHHGRYTLIVKGNGAALLVDKFENFCELDDRMRGRLGVTWELFRDEIRARCDR